jgi:hypothetical protein
MGAATPVEAVGTAHFSTLLNDLYDMTAPGAYMIRVLKTASDPTFGVESNAITVTVTDPPPATISMKLSTKDTQQFSAGSVIEADLAVTNISNAAINLPFDPNHPSAAENGFKFAGLVAGASPNTVVRSKVGQTWKGFKYRYPFQRAVELGQTLHYSIQIATLLDVGTRGAYSIEAKGVDPVTISVSGRTR